MLRNPTMYKGNRKRDTTHSRALLLGTIDEDNEANVYNEEACDVLTQENDDKIKQIGDKAFRMKDLASDISIEINDSIKIIDSMNSDFSEAENLLQDSMTKLAEVAKTASTKQMCYLILFFVFIFILLYYIFKFFY
eukprot:TRINITY_DN1506_c0_g1_i1.p1 TRINITY_DN1506_c0_g1~~TRINITY_DN1506_c0_g1_i1.p1  ORF type:complete len:136 (-),score=30.24 TRINITY_DN1506_c0_g1_i1:94-501(-)